MVDGSAETKNQVSQFSVRYFLVGLLVCDFTSEDVGRGREGRKMSEKMHFFSSLFLCIFIYKNEAMFS